MFYLCVYFGEWELFTARNKHSQRKTEEISSKSKLVRKRRIDKSYFAVIGNNLESSNAAVLWPAVFR